MNRDILIIDHIVKHARKINEKIKCINLKDFNADEDLKEIVCFNFLQIGELVKSLSKEFCNLFKEVPWSDIAKFRDKIVHGYGSLNFEKVYLYSKKEIPFLLKTCEEILKELKIF